MIIGVLIGVIFHQWYSNEKLVNVYKDFSLESKKTVNSMELGITNVGKDMVDIAKVMERVTDSVSRIKADTILIGNVFSGGKISAGSIYNKEKDISYVENRNNED